MDRRTEILMWIAVAVSVAAFQLSPMLVIIGVKESVEDEYYFNLMALFIAVVGLIFYLNFNKKFIGFFFFGLTINNLVDELLFNPLKLQLNELVFVLLLLTIGGYKYTRKSNRNGYESSRKVCTYAANCHNCCRAKADSRK